MTRRGKPALFKNVKQLQAKIDEYFANCPDYLVVTAFDKNEGEFIEYKKYTPTMTGLAMFLGFASRQSFYDYEKKDEFSYTIKKARLRIENEYEKQLYMDKCTGAIFALKNMGWKDKTETEFKAGEDTSTREAYLAYLRGMRPND